MGNETHIWFDLPCKNAKSYNIASRVGLRGGQKRCNEVKMESTTKQKNRNTFTERKKANVEVMNGWNSGMQVGGSGEIEKQNKAKEEFTSKTMLIQRSESVRKKRKITKGKCQTERNPRKTPLMGHKPQ
jgi:hypothetical protein